VTLPLKSSRAPLVSVVVPAYNVAPYIAEALQSVVDQTVADYEIIVVNDGASDTPELEAAITPFRDRLSYLVKENGGVSSARNTGIRHARGEWVVLLDADDILLPHYLEDQLARARQHPTAVVLYGNAVIFGDVPEAGRPFMDLSPSSGPVDFAGIATERCTVPMCSMVRRDVLEQVGLYDTSIAVSEDLDLWLRIAAAGLQFNYTDRVIARYRRRAGSLSSDPTWMARHKCAVLEKCERTLRLSADDRATLHRQLVVARAAHRFHEGKKAFFQGDSVAAVAALEDANAVMRSAKLGLAILALRVAPRLLTALYNTRDRLLFRGKRTKY
jgi:glycosyltransferase involved in cell wall biosynthesis